MGYGPISTELSRSPGKRLRRRPWPQPDLSARSQRRLAPVSNRCRFRQDRQSATAAPVWRQADLTSAKESISMRINAPARLAVAWLTMFLVGTELFVFSPLLPVLAADYHVAPSLAGVSVKMFLFAYMVSAPLF